MKSGAATPRLVIRCSVPGQTDPNELLLLEEALMKSIATTLFCVAVVLSEGLVFAEPPSFNAIDITDWSDDQLATLPIFKRYIPVLPSNAPFGFIPVASSAAGHIAGYTSQTTPYSGHQGVLLRDNGEGTHTVEFIEAFGTYSWGYWSCDSTDCHYYFGYVRDSTPSDLNWSGQTVGSATTPSSGDYASGATYRAYRYDDHFGRIDLFPEHQASRASCINNRGEIAGQITGLGAYRLDPSGVLTALNSVAGYTPTPRWINSRGVIIGSHYPSRAFASPEGSATFSLPDLGGFDAVVANDVNNTGWIVGKSGNFGEQESFATIWEPDPDGTWREYDLVEYLETADLLLENAISIDDQGNIIARGHQDGTDLFNSRLYWLVPTENLPGWCLPDIGLHPQSITTTGTEATFVIKVVNHDMVTSYRWQRDGIDIPIADNPTAALSELILSGLTGADSGATFQCVVTSECGSLASDQATLTVHPRCPSDVNGDNFVDLGDLNLVLANFGQTTPNGDTNGDGSVDLADLNAVLAAFGTECL